MTKRLIVLALVASLIAAFVGPAEAGKKKKKKKGPKPYVSEEVTIEVAHPAFTSASGTHLTITGQEFLASCAVPAMSNGFDAYVFETPEDYVNQTATIKAIGSGSIEGHDLDIYLYNDSCGQVGAYNAAGTDEFGLMAPGTAFILVHNYAGIQVSAHIELEVQ